jgi:hypothetical protein
MMNVLVNFNHITKESIIMSKVQLSESNQKIKQQLISNFRNTKISTDINHDIVKLVAEMTMEAIQLSQEQND